jgi:hypothetical protein
VTTQERFACHGNGPRLGGRGDSQRWFVTPAPL